MSATNPAFPTTFTSDTITNYVTDLGKIGIGFVVVACVLELIILIMILKYAQNKTKDIDAKFSACSRMIHLILTLVCLAVAIIACAVCWSYNVQCEQGVSNAVNSADGLFTNTDGMIVGLNGTLLQLSDDLMGQIDSAIVLSQNFSAMLTPVENILGIVHDMDGQVDILSNATAEVISNVSIIRTELTNLYNYQQQGFISGVPDPNSIPNIDEQYTQDLQEAQQDRAEIDQKAVNLTNNVNTSLTNIATSVAENLKNKSDYYQDQVYHVSSEISTAHVTLSNFKNGFDAQSSVVLYYSHTRTQVVDAILIIPIIVGILSAIGQVFKSKFLLKLALYLAFFCIFWYLLIAGINYIVYVVVYGFCANQSVIVTNAISSENTEINIPGLNHSVILSDKIQELLACSGTTNLVDVFELHSIIDNLNSQVENELNYVDSEKQLLNRSSDYQSMSQYLAQFRQNAIDLNFGSQENITAVENDLNTILIKLDDLNNFNFSDAQYNQSLANVNAITDNNIQLSDGTFLNIFYDSANITSLDCRNSPFTKLDASTQVDLCNKSAIAIAMTYERNEIIAQIDIIRGNISDINQRLIGFNNIYNLANDTRYNLVGYAYDVQDNLNMAYTEASQVMGKITNIEKNIYDAIDNGIDTALQQTECAFIGNTYSELTDSLCTTIRPTFQVVAAMLLLGATSLFFGAIINSCTIYQVSRTYHADSE